MDLTENQRAWIAKLRDPGEKQVQGQLSKGPHRNCCLGVAARMFVGPPRSHGPDPEKFWKTDDNFPPSIVYDHDLRLHSEDGEFGPASLEDSEMFTERERSLYEMDSLAGANDHGFSFSEIADFSEKFPHLVFKKD